MSGSPTQDAAPRYRYGAWTGADSEEIVVKVTAADFNGTEFDGSPFSCKPEWLLEAVKSGAIAAHTRGSTDYAQWDVQTKRGVFSAGPGDCIIRRERGDLSVVEEADVFILANLSHPNQPAATNARAWMGFWCVGRVGRQRWKC